MKAVDILVDEETLTKEQQELLNNQISDWKAQGFDVNIGPRPKPRS